MDNMKHTLDGLSIATVITTFVGWLPPIAALLSIIWLSIQIYDYIKNGKVKNE